MPKYIFSKGTVQIADGIYRQQREKDKQSGSVVLIFTATLAGASDQTNAATTKDRKKDNEQPIAEN